MKRAEEISKENYRCLNGDPRTAEVVIAAGRGLKNIFNFEKMLVLADALRAQVVGTRATVDLGWVSTQREVGLSGLRIVPKIYLSFGISGANFHTIGMYRADLIIAVNTNKNARIFQLADYCVLADAQHVLDNYLKSLPVKSFQNSRDVENFILRNLDDFCWWHNSVRKNE